jgi:hypothetical protein
LRSLSSSLDSKFGKRKTVNMSEEVAQELNRLANLQGRTLYSLINEAGIQAIEAHRQGFSLEEAVAAKKLVRSARRSRMLLVNQDLWYFAGSQTMKHSPKDRWTKMLRNTAQWDANLFVASERGPEEFTEEQFVVSVRRFVEDFFWDCSEMRLEKGESGDGLVLRLAFVPEMPQEHTQGLFKLFEGLFNVQGYVATDSTVKPGFLRVSFKRVSQKA